MILESEQKDQLYTALAQAQTEFPTIRVNRKAFKNEYADLYAILKHVYPVLSKYGLSIRPWGGMINGEQWIGARLMHKSGQYETNVFKFESDPCKNPNDQASHKKQGALTYFNRNHMKDMLGVLISGDPDDDDGQGEATSTHEESPYISHDELFVIHAQMSYIKNESDRKEYAKKIQDHFKIEDLAHIPKKSYSATLNNIIEKRIHYNSLQK